MPLSIDTQLRDALKLRDVSTRVFAAIAKLEGIKNASQPQLDKAFRGAEPLSNEIAEKLWSLWQELDAMALEVYSHAPWAIMNLSDGSRAHTSLQIFRSWRAAFEVLKGDDGKQE